MNIDFSTMVENALKNHINSTKHSELLKKSSKQFEAVSKWITNKQVEQASVQPTQNIWKSLWQQQMSLKLYRQCTGFLEHIPTRRYDGP